MTGEEHMMDFVDIGNIFILELGREYIDLNVFVHYYLKCSSI